MNRSDAAMFLKDVLPCYLTAEDTTEYDYVVEAINTAIKALEQPEPCNLPQLDATCDDEGDILIKGVKFPKGCVYEGKDGKTEYCFLCNHADVPFCMYLEWEPEAAIGIDERPCYCPLKEQEPCEDTVSRKLYEQIKWERALAVDQLADLGYGFGEKKRDSDDAVPRKYILDLLAEYIEEYSELDLNGLHDLKWCAMKEAESVVENAPSVMPKPQWIPCSERLPEKSGLYLTWMRFPYEEEPTWTIENYDADVEAFGEWRERYHPETLGYLDSEFEEIENVTAWMPLPEPYREDHKE